MSQFWSDIVHNLTPYTPGEQPKIDGLIKLNTNENPYGPSPRVIDAIAQANADGLRRYPDPESSQLKKVIAEYFSLELKNSPEPNSSPKLIRNLEPNQVFVGNSSDEVLAHAFRGLLKQTKPLLFPDITYSFYPVYCGLFEIDFQQIPLRDDFTLNIDDYLIENGGIIFANPNAPTGIALPLSEIATLLDKHPNSVIVVDEAYVDFGAESAVSLINRYKNLLVTQTVSKSRSLAGLRVGLALGHAELIEGLERVKNSFHPYALDSLALAGATAAFADYAYFQQTRDKVIATREITARRLTKLGFTVLPSNTNFLFVEHPHHAASQLFKELRERNIVVRYFDKPRISNYLRISIGTDEEMDVLSSQLEDILRM